MRDFPSCFSENGVQVADASCSSVNLSKTSQNLVICLYQCNLLGKFYFIKVTWSKNLMGHFFGVEIEDLSHQCLCRADVKPSLFSKRKGSKSLEVNSCKIGLYWDLSLAKFGSGPEPSEGFYLAIVCKGELVWLIGDLKKEALNKTCSIPSLSTAIFVSKRAHILGKKVYGTKAQFCNNGQIHDLMIECDNATGIDDPCLSVHVDGKILMQVKHLHWKFRGNYTILVDGLPVEIFWDVYDWFFGASLGHAVFIFQSCLSAEKQWTGQTFSDLNMMPWPHSRSFSGSKLPGLGFCLILHAWKSE